MAAAAAKQGRTGANMGEVASSSAPLVVIGCGLLRGRLKRGVRCEIWVKAADCAGCTVGAIADLGGVEGEIADFLVA